MRPGDSADRTTVPDSVPDSTPPDSTPATDPPDVTDATDDTSVDTSVPGETIPETGPRFSFDAAKPEQGYDAFLEKAINDIQDYWRYTYPLVYGGDFKELEGGVVAAYPGMGDGPTGCDLTRATYDEIRQLRAFYCSDGDFIAYDDGDLFPTLDTEIGRFSLAMALSHEFGHAVQQRARMRGATILLEQQADCFAGAWVRHAADGGAGDIKFNDDDLNVSLTGLIAFRDAPGVMSNDPQAHGSGFDRVGAFQEGWFGGAARCKTFDTDAPPTTQLPFTTGDVSTGGNAPYDQLIDFLRTALDAVWTAELATRAPGFTAPLFDIGSDATSSRCADVPEGALRVAYFCTATNTIVASERRLRQLYDRYGDNAAGVVIAEAYSDAAQVALNSSLSGELRALTSDCFTGAWTRALFPDETTTKEVVISAGDLDEAIQTLIVIGDPSADTNLRGSPFEKIDSFRKGVLGGMDTCTALLAP